jgi:hypothetical protein
MKALMASFPAFGKALDSPLVGRKSKNFRGEKPLICVTGGLNRAFAVKAGFAAKRLRASGI